MTARAALPVRRAVVEHVMGLPVSIHLRGAAETVDGEAAREAVRALVGTLHDVDAVLSPYRADSDVRRMARGELEAVDAHPWTRQVLDRCESWRRRTDGWFDAGYGGTDPDGGPLPVDPTGLVKGWAVDVAASALRSVAALDGTDWYVGAGGDVLLAASGDRSWRIGLQHPRHRDRTLTTLQLSGGAVATSGSAARGLHILDPRTGRAALDVVQASVVAPTLEEADVLATAAVAAGTRAEELMRDLAPERWWLVRRDGQVQFGP